MPNASYSDNMLFSKIKRRAHGVLSLIPDYKNNAIIYGYAVIPEDGDEPKEIVNITNQENLTLYIKWLEPKRNGRRWVGYIVIGIWYKNQTNSVLRRKRRRDYDDNNSSEMSRKRQRNDLLIQDRNDENMVDLEQKVENEENVNEEEEDKKAVS